MVPRKYNILDYGTWNENVLYQIGAIDWRFACEMLMWQRHYVTASEKWLNLKTANNLEFYMLPFKSIWRWSLSFLWLLKARCNFSFIIESVTRQAFKMNKQTSKNKLAKRRYSRLQKKSLFALDIVLDIVFINTSILDRFLRSEIDILQMVAVLMATQNPLTLNSWTQCVIPEHCLSCLVLDKRMNNSLWFCVVRTSTKITMQLQSGAISAKWLGLILRCTDINEPKDIH